MVSGVPLFPRFEMDGFFPRLMDILNNLGWIICLGSLGTSQALSTGQSEHASVAKSPSSSADAGRAQGESVIVLCVSIPHQVFSAQFGHQSLKSVALRQ